jgi:hypothetical protein
MTDDTAAELLRLQSENAELKATIEKAGAARKNVSHALNIVGQIRQGGNIPSHELWDACEYLDKALSSLPRLP